MSDSVSSDGFDAHRRSATAALPEGCPESSCDDLSLLPLSGRGAAARRNRHPSPGAATLRERKPKVRPFFAEGAAPLRWPEQTKTEGAAPAGLPTSPTRATE